MILMLNYLFRHDKIHNLNNSRRTHWKYWNRPFFIWILHKSHIRLSRHLFAHLWLLNNKLIHPNFKPIQMLYGQVSALWIIKREECESFITLILGIILQIEGFQNPKLGQKSPNFIIAHLFGYIPHIKLDFWSIRVICKKGSLWVHLSLLGMQKLLDSLHRHLTPLPLNAIRFETNFQIGSKHEF